ncbi:MAG: nodulation protein NfeD [Chloroflexi bacterium]|nr:nodulation protein NfeD [Chloroflexota bacterium]
MKKLWRAFAIALIGLSFALPTIVKAQSGVHVDVLRVEGAIDTWTSGYIDRGISVAEQDGAQAVIIILNTPGGVLGAMQEITTRMLNARVPTVVFVYPQGAWAGSAGTFITLAGNIAAMAPSTTIGAAHPVDSSGQNIPSDERDKITNFSVGVIKNIAQQRGRNAEWAAKAVESSVAATAQEALDQKVIDLIATDVNDLLNKIDGKTVKTVAGEFKLNTQRAGINNLDMNIAELLLHTIVDPNLALILLQIGLLAIAVELYNPGATIPAIVGGICLILAFVALGNLPVNWGGVILIVLSVILFILDVKVTGFVLTIGGAVMFILGALLLFTPFTPSSPSLPDFGAPSVSPVLVVVLAVSMAGFFLLILGAAVRGRNFPVLSGSEAMIGAEGVALSDIAPSGMAHVKGEDWSAETQEGSISKGEEVQVVAIEGLRLKVVKK